MEAFEHYEFAKEKQADSDYSISLVQEAIGHAAALSRYFWPVWYPGKLNKTHPYQAALRKKRGEKLISAFGMEEDSPIHNRDLRNAWEHFDENLDDYLLKNDAGHFFLTQQLAIILLLTNRPITCLNFWTQKQNALS